MADGHDRSPRFTRALELLRGAMHWGIAQTPPLFRKSPFHRFAVRMNKKLETSRDRRLTRDEEKQLLDTALQRMNVAGHRFAGPLLHDRIIGALELVCRRGEMLLLQIGIPDEELRRGLEVSWSQQGRPLGRSPRNDKSHDCSWPSATSELVAGAGFEPATFGL
jgi:hypothetical protein